MMRISIEEDMRSGKDITIRKVDADYSEINVNVNVSPQFFGWIFSLGKDVKVTGPSEVVEEMKKAAADSLLQNRNGIEHINIVDFMRKGKNF